MRFLAHLVTTPHPRRAAIVLALVALLPAAAAAGLAAPSGRTAPSAAAGDICPGGDVRCVDAVIREMNRRLAREAQSCSHDAPFSVQYLRTTESYRRHVENPSFFEDNAFVNHEDAVFASYYFKAQDAFRAGRLAAVPRAWQIAFDASSRRAVSASGNVLLGVNAHVNRDLPFVLEAIGAITPDRRRKADHDKVNEIFPEAQAIATPEIARRFDPTFDDANAPGTFIDDQFLIDLIAVWREEAWQNAVRLVEAPSPAARALVARSIEDAAAAKAQGFVTLTAYGPLGSSAARDAWCAVHGTAG